MSDRPDIFMDSPDALSQVLVRLQLQAEVYVYGDFCGNWAVDTSGSRRIPFHLVGEGQAWLHVDGQPPLRLTTGDLVVFPSDQPHILAGSAEQPDSSLLEQDPTAGDGAVTSMICGFFEFRDRSAWPLLDALAPVIRVSLTESHTAAQVNLLVEWLIRELQQQQPGYYAVLNQLAYLLFIQVIREQMAEEEVTSGMLAALFDKRMSRALEAIHNHPEQSWTLESLAQQAAMGRSTFAARFNELAGMPPLQYLTAWRMREARSMLQNTELSIADIAERCGYQSDAAFRKVFRKVVGQTPGEVRKSGR